jgi:hypothetical protein
LTVLLTVPAAAAAASPRCQRCDPGLHEVRGDILRPTTAAPRQIAEQAIPRSGVVLTRAWQRTRWIDGSIHMWVERRKRSGRGEGSSGLRYDAVDLEGATDPS